MTRKFFGTDGIRGRVGDGVMTPEFVLKLGWAAGRVLCKNNNNLVLIWQGYAYIRVHAGISAGSRFVCRRCK